MAPESVPDGGRYAAVIVYESSSPAAGYRPLYEETVTVVRAASSEEAWEAARRFGRSRERSYRNANGETVTVALKRILDVAVIADDLTGDAEVYTRHFRDYGAYQAFEPLLSGEQL